MKLEELQDLNNRFLSRWNIETVSSMTLQQYVGLGNKDTFCQWVETETRALGSIKGWSSLKFGIYERKDKQSRPSTYTNDDSYSWLKSYNVTESGTAFKIVKENILTVIKNAIIGDFKAIDKINIPDLFKWKVAFLYSDERLIPIFQRETLFKIAKHYGLKTNRQTEISEIQSLMIEHKPPGLNVIHFMWQLFRDFGNKKEKEELEENNERSLGRKRKASAGRNTSPHTRQGSGKSFVVQQRHNIIQEALKLKLIAEYGEKSVIPMEENYVDLKLIQPDYIAFYEVKSAGFAVQCIREALGQILLYTFVDKDPKRKKLVVVGQNKPTANEMEYIEFIKKNLALDFEYLAVDIN